MARPFASTLVLTALAALTGCHTSAPGPIRTPAAPVGLEVSTVHDNPAERATRDQLLRLAATYDLSRFMLTKTIAIDEEAIPHSHPVLTLHTRHLRDDDQLLSTFVHEEMPWRLHDAPEKTAAAVTDLRAAFPELPVGFPDGANDETSSYEHLVVILLEQRGLEAIVGHPRAVKTFDFWERDHYRALYRVVRENDAQVEAIARKHELL